MLWVIEIDFESLAEGHTDDTRLQEEMKHGWVTQCELSTELTFIELPESLLSTLHLVHFYYSESLVQIQQIAHGTEIFETEAGL